MDNFARKLRLCCARLVVDQARRRHYDESGDARYDDNETTATHYTDDDRMEVMTIAHEILSGSVIFDRLEIELVMHDVVSEVVRTCKD